MEGPRDAAAGETWRCLDLFCFDFNLQPPLSILLSAPGTPGNIISAEAKNIYRETPNVSESPSIATALVGMDHNMMCTFLFVVKS